MEALPQDGGDAREAAPGAAGVPIAWGVHLSWAESSTDGLYRGSDRVPSPSGAEVRFRELGIQGSVQLEETFQAHLRLTHLEIDREEGGTEVRHLSGIGDTAAYVTWQPAESFTLLGGLKLPTGESAKNPQPGVLPPSVLQLGTGTFDGLLGVQYSTRVEHFRLRSSVFAQLPAGESSANLAPAEILRLSAGAVWLGGLAGWEPGLDLEAEFRGKDELNGVTLPSTGSSVWSLRPSFRFRLGDEVGLHADLRIPIARQVSGTQLIPGTQFSAAVELRF